jgi:hypothetical protein
MLIIHVNFNIKIIIILFKLNFFKLNINKTIFFKVFNPLNKLKRLFLKRQVLFLFLKYKILNNLIK